MNKKYIKIWLGILVVLLCFISYGGYKYYNNKMYNRLSDEANSYMKKGQYQEAADTYEKAVKYKDDDKLRKNLKQTEEELSKNSNNGQKDEEKNTENNSYLNAQSDTITKEKAEELTAMYYKDKNNNTKFVFDHEDTRDNQKYYVIQVFDSMEDHSATVGWYYVNEENGKVYEWDLGENKLIPVN